MSADKHIPLAERLEELVSGDAYRFKRPVWARDEDFEALTGGSRSFWSSKTAKLTGIVLATIALVAALISIPASRNKDYRSALESMVVGGAPKSLQDDIFNSTLGFQKLFAINLKEESDHRDSLTLAAAVSNIQLDWIDGVWGDDVPLDSLPPGPAKEFTKSGIGSWRAHMNALRAVVEQNITTAVIFEDDVDWDIRIKSQLFDFATSAHALIQPLKSRPGSYADPTFPIVGDAEFQPAAMDFAHLPNSQPPVVSPYGDDFDVLWLGHCGMRRPTADQEEQIWHDVSTAMPKGHVAHYDDITVPEPHYIHVLGDENHPRFRHDFANHTRVTHHSMDGVCCLAYAVTQAGARKLLLELDVRGFDDYFDIMLRNFCQSQGRDRHERHTCLSVQPTLFDTHLPSEEVGGKGYTANIRWSTRQNMEVLLRGETKFEDGMPDTV